MNVRASRHKHRYWESKMVQPLWETMWQALRKLNIYLTLEIGIPLLNTFLREIKTNIHATVYTGIITTALLFTGQNLSQLTSPSTGAWMRKQTVAEPMHYSSAIKRNELLTPPQMMLTNIMLIKRRHKRGHIVWFHTWMDMNFFKERNLSFSDLKNIDLKQLRGGAVHKGSLGEDGCVHLSKSLNCIHLK